MVFRNLLFSALVLFGVVALAANLIPPRHGVPPTPTYPDKYQEKDFTETIRKVDEAFETAWKKKVVQPTTPADILLVARRLALGLMGTIPSLEEIRQFESFPQSERVTWWIDHILQDRRYADYIAERLARAFVGTENGPFILFRRRKFTTWLADEVAKNTPYDQMVRQLIASEGLWTEKPATNFITVTSQNDKQNQPDPIRLAGRVTRAFLGLRLDCAQCHDHPFASWKKMDFESFSAFFGQTHVGFRGVYDGLGEYQVEEKVNGAKRTVTPKVSFAENLLPAEGTLRTRLSHWVTDKENPYFSLAVVNRLWAIMCGQPLVSPVDNLETEKEIPTALRILAGDFSSHDFDLARLVRLIASTKAFQLQSQSTNETAAQPLPNWAQFPLTRLRPEQVAGSILQATSIATINADSHIITRIARFGQQNDFVSRYGDSGEDEFDNRGGTIPQRLIMMNGKLVSEKTGGGPFAATSRIQWLSPDDPKTIETIFLALLTRRPTPGEETGFREFLSNPEQSRGQAIQDFFWALINSTEFSWNH